MIVNREGPFRVHFLDVLIFRGFFCYTKFTVINSRFFKLSQKKNGRPPCLIILT